MNPKRTKPIFLAIAALTVLTAFFIRLRAQSANQPSQAELHSVWDGVYNEKQAERGAALYYQECSSCHGDKLTGKESENSPPLAGEKFTTQWNGRTVGDMFRKILRKMPDDDPGTLTPQQSADLVAFILSFNKFPAGKAELPAGNESLATIRFDAKKPEHK